MPSEVPREIEATLDEVWLRMRGLQFLGWVAIAVLAILIVVMFGKLPDKSNRNYLSSLLPIVTFSAASVGLSLMPFWVRYQHKRLMMPVMAKSRGLNYADRIHVRLKSFPPRLLPWAGARHNKNLLTGDIDGHPSVFAEVRIETGGKGSRVYFQGIAMEFQNAKPLPVFFVARDAKTHSSSFRKRGTIGVGDLYRLGTEKEGTELFGVWTTTPTVADCPAFRAVLHHLMSVPEAADKGARLYSAMSDGTRTWVAIRLKRRLFRIGGLFATRSSVLSDLSRALDDMQMPFRIAAVLLQAERDVVAAGQ